MIAELYAIKEAAKESRAWAEGLVAQYGYPSDLCGLCALASKDLWRRLKARGIPARIAYCPGHVFVRIPHLNILVDVTATQFGKKKIEIRKWPESRHYHWRTDWCQEFDTAEEFHVAQVKKVLGKWCKCEITPSFCPEMPNGCR
jgi:hypothetical protein